MSGDYGLFLDADGLIDAAFTVGDIEADQGLETAVLISLFSDARATEDLIPPIDRDGNLRGYWGDVHGTLPGDATGSLLWTIRRAKQLSRTLADAKGYAERSLRWLVDDAVASSVEVLATYPRLGWMRLEVLIYRPQSSNPVVFRYDYQWSNQILKGA